MKKDDIWILAFENAPFAKESTPLDFLKEQDSEIIYNLINKEPSSVVATVLHCLGREKGKSVVERFNSIQKKEILRIMYLGNLVDDSVMNIISKTLKNKI